MSTVGPASPMQAQQGPPYLPTTAGLGGQPTVSVDDPICAVLLFLFVCGAATHMTIFQLNRKHEHKFLFSALLFGFCMARITALTMRIVWASRPTNINIAIAANVLVAAGVLLLFVVNLVFTQRMLRAYHPHLGWHRAIHFLFIGLYAVIVALLVMVITATVQSFFTLDGNTRRIDRDIQLFAVTFLAALAFAPIPIVLLAALVPRENRVEKFGTGRFRTKTRLLLFTATLLSLGAGFRAGVAWDVRPASQPAWFHHKACYYVFNYGIELIVVYTYAIARFDRRFHVPDGSSGPGHYAGEHLRQKDRHDSLAMSERVNKEEEVFGPAAEDSEGAAGPSSGREDVDWERRARRELAQGLDVRGA